MKKIKVNPLLAALVLFVIGCNEGSKKTEVMTHEEFSGSERGYWGSNPYLAEAYDMSKKVKSRQATLGDLIALCEDFLKRDVVQKDTNILGPLYLVYGTALDAVGEPGRAEAVMFATRDLALAALTGKEQRVALASVTSVLAEVYLHQRKTGDAIRAYQELIENYRDLELTDNKGKMIKESFATVSIGALGKIFEQEKTFDDGISYFTRIAASVPGSATSCAALTQTYNLQMMKGDESGSATTYETLQREYQFNPDFKKLSEGMLKKWEAMKNGAHLTSEHRHGQ